MNDPFSILGLKPPCTQEEIKKAFRRLAHIYHPDKGGSEEKFKEINEAYQMIKDGKINQVIPQGYSTRKENWVWVIRFNQGTGAATTQTDYITYT